MNQKQELSFKLKQLRETLALRDGMLIEVTAEEVEKVRSQSDRDIEVTRMDRDTATVQLILAALRRMDEGEYGLCIDCEEHIAERRLMAIPWAPRCIRCQEDKDERERTRSNFPLGFPSVMDAAA